MKASELIKEVDGIETLGQLREAIADQPDDTPVSDGMGMPLLLSFLRTHNASEGGKYPPLDYIEIQ